MYLKLTPDISVTNRENMSLLVNMTFTPTTLHVLCISSFISCRKNLTKIMTKRMIYFCLVLQQNLNQT